MAITQADRKPIIQRARQHHGDRMAELLQLRIAARRAPQRKQALQRQHTDDQALDDKLF